MSYTWEFTLKKTGLCEWSIYSSHNICMYTLPRCETQDLAMDLANAWISSWTSSVIRMESDEQQDKSTD